MHNLTPLALDDAQVFDNIAAAKRNPTRAHLTTIRAGVVASYQDYTHAAPDVGGLVPINITNDQHAALIHAYEVPTAPMNRLREDLLTPVAAAKCPFCGISESSTLDHYLPKEGYPSFSVFSPNLVPCCGRCNNRKGEMVVNAATNVRYFLHLYFDILPNKPFLHVDVTVQPTVITLTFRVIRPKRMQLARFQQIESHFRLLDLADRYRRMSLNELGGLYHSIERFYGADEDASRVADGLNDWADSFAAEFGTNHWRVSLYRALAASDEFCDGGFRAIVNVV